MDSSSIFARRRTVATNTMQEQGRYRALRGSDAAGVAALTIEKDRANRQTDRHRSDDLCLLQWTRPT